MHIPCASAIIGSTTHSKCLSQCPAKLELFGPAFEFPHGCPSPCNVIMPFGLGAGSKTSRAGIWTDGPELDGPIFNEEWNMLLKCYLKWKMFRDFCYFIRSRFLRLFILAIGLAALLILAPAAFKAGFFSISVFMLVLKLSDSMSIKISSSFSSPTAKTDANILRPSSCLSSTSSGSSRESDTWELATSRASATACTRRS